MADSKKTTTEKPADKGSEPVFILNNSAKLVFPVPPGKKPTPVRLMPGLNRIPRKDWDAVRDSKFVQVRLREEVLEELHTESPELTALPKPKALALVRQTFDRVLLKQWSDAEQRQDVKKAIAQQLELLDGSKAAA